MAERLPLNKVTDIVKRFADAERGEVVCIINRTGLNRAALIRRLAEAVQGTPAEIVEDDPAADTAMNIEVMERRGTDRPLRVYVAEPGFAPPLFVSARVLWIEAG